MATVLEYAEQVAALIENAHVTEVEKANGIIHVGIVLRKEDSKVAPTVYIESMYNQGLSVEQAVEEVKKIADANSVEDDEVQVERYNDFEGYVKAHLRARLYNNSTSAEVKRAAGKYGFKGLIIVPVVLINVGDIEGSIRVKQEHLDVWGVTAKEVIDIALENTKEDVSIQELWEFLGKSKGIPEDMAREMFSVGPEMYIVSNKDCHFGAAAILGKIKDFKKKFKNGFYVVPSSLHETIVVPTVDGMPKDYVDWMVKTVNSEEVSPEERLSDESFFFG